MKRYDNTLYINTQKTYLARQRESLAVRQDGKTKAMFPVHTLGGVVCFGNISFSPFALGLCGESGVTVSLLTERGRFLARVEGPTSGNVLLRRAQYRTSDAPEAADIARVMVAAKIANARAVLLRARRDRPDNAEHLGRAADRLAQSLQVLTEPCDLDTVRGTEGEAALSYFGVFNQLVLVDGDAFVFHGRSRRPPRDRVNAMMSFLSVLLAHDLRSACEAVGLDPQVGFLHRDRPGRASLALDLMEELRPVVVDRLLLSLINRRQVDSDGFTITASGGVEMDELTRKTILVAWQERKKDELTHPYLGEKITLGLLPHVQARLLARRLRNDLEAYPPFFWK